jgi:hypothetical protein
MLRFFSHLIKKKNKKTYKYKNTTNISNKFDKVIFTKETFDTKEKIGIKLPISKKSFFKDINKKLTILLITTFILSILYLGLIDKYFLVKNIDIVFPNGSYLSNEDTKRFKENYEKQVLGLFAKNNIWFASSSMLTSIAKEFNSNIVSVEIVSRELPNKLQLSIITKPVLATLILNDNQAWRIDSIGNFVTQDDIGLNENPIYIRQYVTWNTTNYKLNNFNLNNLEGQLDKVYFVKYVRNILTDLNYTAFKTDFESFVENTIYVQINNNTSLIFDYKSISMDNINNKIVNILNNKKLNTELIADKISYIDFRLADNIFICYKESSCKL